MSEKEKETIEEEDTPVLTTLDKNEKDVETILDFLLSHGDPGQRGNALIRLEELGPDLSIDDLNFTTEILNKARKEEEVGKLIRKIDELLNEFWKYKKGLEFDGLEKPISLEVKKKVEQKKKEYALTLEQRKFSDPIQGETVDHLANLQALPAIEDHLSWIALSFKISLVLFAITVFFAILLFLLLMW